MTDLSRKISVPHAMDFMAISSYGAGSRSSSGVVRITMDLTTNISNKDVLIVEDIIDSGNTHVLCFGITFHDENPRV